MCVCVCVCVQCREAAAIREVTCTAIQNSCSEKRREHWQEVYRQRVRLIRLQESDDCHSQSPGLAKWSN